jgi:hypothetical protein
MSKLYALPVFLEGVVAQSGYYRWLERKADAHVKRDRKRSGLPVSEALYRRLIHDAVCASGGRDFYTGEELDWSLLSTYDNKISKAEGSIYKARLALLPTVDNVRLSDGRYNFVICGWRTNDAKNDLDHEAFVSLCRRVIAHRDRVENQP